MFYQPAAVPADPSQLAGYLQSELTRLALILSQHDDSLGLKTLYAAPSRIVDGIIVKADGVTWNPGAGSGVYVYRDAAWHLLG